VWLVRRKCPTINYTLSDAVARKLRG
jgi:hypothetical protein